MSELTDEQAADFALSFSELERRVILHLSQDRAKGYSRIAELLGETYSRVQVAGRRIQAKKLGYVSVVRDKALDEYVGSALFLNSKGEQVKRAVELLERLKADQ